MLRDFVYLLFPSYCAACTQTLHKNERLLCVTCRHKLSLAKKIEKVFYGRIKIENAAALFLFQKNSRVQNLIHNLKYRGKEEIGSEIGKWMGEKLYQNTDFENVNYVIPVPIHKKRFRERGYNQVEKFGVEIAKKLNATYIDNILKKKVYHSKQSKRDKESRWTNIYETFEMQNESLLENKHVLLIDDIVTTGATIEACVHMLQNVPNIKISVATMAITD